MIDYWKPEGKNGIDYLIVPKMPLAKINAKG